MIQEKCVFWHRSTSAINNNNNNVGNVNYDLSWQHLSNTEYIFSVWNTRSRFTSKLEDKWLNQPYTTHNTQLIQAQNTWMFITLNKVNISQGEYLKSRWLLSSLDCGYEVFVTHFKGQFIPGSWGLIWQRIIAHKI